MKTKSEIMTRACIYNAMAEDYKRMSKNAKSEWLKNHFSELAEKFSEITTQLKWVVE